MKVARVELRMAGAATLLTAFDASHLEECLEDDVDELSSIELRRRQRREPRTEPLTVARVCLVPLTAERSAPLLAERLGERLLLAHADSVGHVAKLARRFTAACR